VTIERTFDYRRVMRLVDWQPVISREFVYLVESSQGQDLGLWSFHKDRGGLRIHADMGPKCRGRKAVESMKSAFSWVFENMDIKTIYAGIPIKNKPACRIAAWSGMRCNGNKNGRRHYEVRKCHS